MQVESNEFVVWVSKKKRQKLNFSFLKNLVWFGFFIFGWKASVLIKLIDIELKKKEEENHTRAVTQSYSSYIQVLRIRKRKNWKKQNWWTELNGVEVAIFFWKIKLIFWIFERKMNHLMRKKKWLCNSENLCVRVRVRKRRKRLVMNMPFSRYYCCCRRRCRRRRHYNSSNKSLFLSIFFPPRCE